MTASKRRHETAAVHEGLYTKEGTRPDCSLVYGPNHEVVGLSVVGLRTPLPKMRWVAYGQTSTPRIFKTTQIAKGRLMYAKTVSKYMPSINRPPCRKTTKSQKSSSKIAVQRIPSLSDAP